MSQTERIKRYLDKHGSITTKEAFQMFGCTRLPARMYDLKKQGYAFITEFETGKNQFGEVVTWARYKRLSQD